MRLGRVGYVYRVGSSHVNHILSSLLSSTHLPTQFSFLIPACTIVGVASGFIDANLISFILQKAVYFMIFAWPIMYKGRRGGDNDVEDEEGTEREE